MNIRPITIACAIAASCACIAPLSADPEDDASAHSGGGGPHVITIRTVSPERQFHERWQRGDHAGAAEAIELALRSRPNDALLLYNRACAKAQLGKLDAAADSLMNAVRNGFDHFSHMQRDSDLKPLRGHQVFRAIIDARQFADELLAERRLETWRDRMGTDHHTLARDQTHQLTFLHALDEDAFADLRAEIDKHLAMLNGLLFDEPTALWTVVALPERDGEGGGVGRAHAFGAYRHHQRELIALDRDITLRHELVHLLHHRHMDDLGQQHPMWIQEGLAVMFEQYEREEAGGVRFMPGDRRNFAKRLLDRDRLLPWREIMTMSDARFNRASQVTYAQVDAMMRFIDEVIGLERWYRAYVADHAKDASGIYTLESLFDASLDEIEQQWRAWLAERPFIVSR